jgi:hypothetical protein
MRWTGKGVVDKRECPIFYSCHKEKHILGAGRRVINPYPANVENKVSS